MNLSDNDLVLIKKDDGDFDIYLYFGIYFENGDCWMNENYIISVFILMVNGIIVDVDMDFRGDKIDSLKMERFLLRF